MGALKQFILSIEDDIMSGMPAARAIDLALSQYEIDPDGEFADEVRAHFLSHDEVGDIANQPSSQRLPH